MKKVIIWGTGKHYVNHKILLNPEWEIIAFVDNAIEKRGRLYDNKKVIGPGELNSYEYDLLVIASMAKAEIIHQAMSELQIPAEKITLINCYRLMDPQKVHIQVQQDETTKMNIAGIEFICRTTSDYNVAQDVFDDGDYRLVDTNHEYSVIDIGMNIGLASLYFASWENVRKVYSFEPFPETYRQAKGNIERNSEQLQKKITTYPYALSNQNEERTVFYSGLSSEGMNIRTCKAGDDKNCVSIIVRDAADMLLPLIKNNHDKVLLKMDCEGSEYEIIQSLSEKKVLDFIDVILMECHIFAKNKELENMLSQNHYQFIFVHRDHNIGFLYAFRMK